MHPSGEQLSLYTGVAATLRFPISEEEKDIVLIENCKHNSEDEMFLQQQFVEMNESKFKDPYEYFMNIIS